MTPTTLVEVRRENDLIHARVCDTKLLLEAPDYLTLSHCWGPKSFYKLTKANKDENYGAVPVEKLSPLFRDAMRMTLELEYRFIWIDSLCIIQDDGDSSDWKRESLLMDGVYWNSTCNLSAMAYENGQLGLFGSFQQSPDTLVKIGASRYHLNQSVSWEDLKHGPLLGRGWVMQENAMAFRILHFGKDQLLSECCSLKASEQFPKGLYIQHRSPQNGLLHKLRKTSQPLLYHDFYDIIEDYSKTELTYPADELPAISGILTFRIQKSIAYPPTRQVKSLVDTYN